MTRIAIKFGIFVLVCTSFTIWLAFLIGNIDFKDPLGRDNFELTATFDNAQGLLVNDNVKISGVPVGKVTKIDVEEGRARVTIQVSNDYADELPSDTSAAIRWRNLIGQRYLYLYPGVSSTTLEDGGTIEETEDVVDLGELFNRLGPIVASIDEGQVNEFLEAVTQALQGNEDRVGQAIADLGTLAEGLATRDDTIGRLIVNLDTITGTIASRDQQIRTLLENLLAISEAFSSNTDVLDAALQEVGGLSVDLSTLVGTSGDEVDRIIASLDTLLAETIVPRLDQLGSSLGVLDEASRSIFNSGRYGEWLNQDIRCVSITAPPCPTPFILGASAPQQAQSAAGASSASFESGVQTIGAIVLGANGRTP
jgi:phospholipid/cholesterol/gamma-HCH transport system substrate-binding protein